MTGASSRRAEAHLWLLLEEALSAVRRGGADVAEVRRNFNAVTAALAAAEVLDANVARRLRSEFGDVLAVRGLLPLAEFVGPADPDSGTLSLSFPAAPAPNGAVVWLEAEIERHLDLLAGFDPTTRPSAGLETLRLLGGPVRAFEAARAMGPEGRALMTDLAVTLRRAGFETRRLAPDARPGEGQERRSWLAFLRSGMEPIAVDFTPEFVRRPSVTLGDIGQATVQISSVAWTAEAIEIIAPIRHPPLDVTMLDKQWLCRVVDERGGLHLGQSVRHTHDGGMSARFLLRPGLPPDATQIEVRVTSGGRRVNGNASL